MTVRLDRMIKPELEEYITNCNFLAEELQVFTRRARGETIEYIAEMESMSVSTVKRILARIQAKIDRFQNCKGAHEEPLANCRRFFFCAKI